MRRAISIALLITALAWCTPAVAAAWSATGDATFNGSLVKGDGSWLELPWEIVWQQPVPDIRSLERLDNGNTLVSSGLGFVQVLSPGGAVVWEYRLTDRPEFTPWHATMTPSGNVLIVSRREGTVFEVDYDTKEMVWRYGQGVTETAAPGWVVDPFMATRLPNGNTLICDNRGERVFEVRTSDYVAGAPDDGYTAESIVWTFVAAPTTRPKYAQRLPSGNTLIAGASHGVLEVDPGGAVVWQVGPGVLDEPVSAVRLANGNTLIAEERSLDSTLGSVLIVNPSGEIVWRYGVMSLLGLDDIGLSAPRRAVPSPDGSILIADQRNSRVLELGYTLTGDAATPPLDCGLPGARKLFTSISVDLDVPAGTTAAAEYSIDGGAWQTLGGSALPSGTYGTLVAVRVTMATTRRDKTPRLLGLSIGYEPAPESAGGSGTGTGTGTGSGSGSRSGTKSGRSTTTGTAAGTGGTMTGGGGYTTGGVSGSASVVAGPLSVQRGWAMDSVSISVGPDVDGPGDLGGGGSPAPDLGGLLALGTIYTAGVLSVPLQRLLALLFLRSQTA